MIEKYTIELTIITSSLIVLFVSLLVCYFMSIPTAPTWFILGWTTRGITSIGLKKLKERTSDEL